MVAYLYSYQLGTLCMTKNLQRQIVIRRLCGYALHPVFLASAVNLETDLFKELMKGYNKQVRPTEKSGDITRVSIKVTLTNLISLVSKMESRGLILTRLLTSAPLLKK